MEYIHIKWTPTKKSEKSAKNVKYDNNTQQQKYVINNDDIIERKQYDCFKKVVEIKENKKDICSKRMADRELITCSNTNPYMVKNNYLDDINIQSQFLIPQNSNFGE
tara:strand:- start:4239 stop:4559 length:321 start_codon:yes stop_codon:yes gene_type:complete